MDPVMQLHGSLLRHRTGIRHHKNTLHWMKRCWRAVPHDDPERLSQDEYEVIYSTLLYEMTICWEDETSDTILAKMWQRDACSFEDLDFDRFCCSLFRYIEMWADEVTQEAYDRVFELVYAILVGSDESMGSQCTSPTTKPTLENVNCLIDHEKRMDELNLSLGKSVLFNSSEYVRLYGAPPSVQVVSEDISTSKRSRPSTTQENKSPTTRFHLSIPSPKKSSETARPGSTCSPSRRTTYRTSDSHELAAEKVTATSFQLTGRSAPVSFCKNPHSR